MSTKDSSGVGEPSGSDTGAQVSDNYETVRDQIENQSATEELSSLLAAEDTISAAEAEPERIEIYADRDDIPINWGVTIPAIILVAAVVIWGLVFQENFTAASTAAFSWVTSNLGWAFLLLGTVFVFFVIILALSKFGRIRLGQVDEQPEFRTVSWISMMFAAGMGIGLMFYGASEPLAFYRDGIPEVAPGNIGDSMATALYHWTLHPWSLYAIVGGAIAYSTYRLGRKQLISSAFTPLIGEKNANGWVGQIIDILAIFASVFGTACSLGLGTLQIQAGLEASGFIENPGQGLIFGIVLVLTLAFLLSALSGVGKGIQYLSNFNMVIAALLAIFVFVFGPTMAQLNVFPTAVSSYLQNFFEMASWTPASDNGTAGEFLGGWTIFYWAWWVSWSPFVGMFLARISRGRTIREFCLSVVFIPAGVAAVWFSIMGGSAIFFEANDQSIYGGGTTEEQLFNLLNNLPMGAIASVFAVILLATFFITSADSASTVMGSMSQNGAGTARRWVTGMWGVLAALVGLTLLISGGEDALNSLQNVTIVAATPFLVIVFLLMFAWVKDLRNDVIYQDTIEQQNFARQLAIERRLHREQVYRDAQKERRRSVLKRSEQ